MLILLVRFVLKLIDKKTIYWQQFSYLFYFVIIIIITAIIIIIIIIINIIAIINVINIINITFRGEGWVEPIKSVTILKGTACYCTELFLWDPSLLWDEVSKKEKYKESGTIRSRKICEGVILTV